MWDQALDPRSRTLVRVLAKPSKARVRPSKTWGPVLNRRWKMSVRAPARPTSRSAKVPARRRAKLARARDRPPGKSAKAPVKPPKAPGRLRSKWVRVLGGPPEKWAKVPARQPRESEIRPHRRRKARAMLPGRPRSRRAEQRKGYMTRPDRRPIKPRALQDNSPIKPERPFKALGERRARLPTGPGAPTQPSPTARSTKTPTESGGPFGARWTR